MDTDTLVETERLAIRLWRPEEAPRLLDILSRVEVVRWLDDGPPKLMSDLDQAARSIQRYRELSETPPHGFWGVEVRETGVVAGTVLLSVLPGAEDGETELGWHLHPDSWGHGYATEAAGALLGWGLSHGLAEVFSLTHLDNYPSQAVARRIGMEDLGETDDWYDEPSRIFRARASGRP